MIIGLFSGKSNPMTVYDTVGMFIRDFFGLAYILDGVTPFCGAWWYISFAITLYLLFPLMYKAVAKYPKFMLVVSFVIGIKSVTTILIITEWQRYFFVCCLGIYLAQHNLLGSLVSRGKHSSRIIMRIKS